LLVNSGGISPEIAWENTKEENNSERDRILTFQQKERLKDQSGEFNVGEGLA